MLKGTDKGLDKDGSKMCSSLLYDPNLHNTSMSRDCTILRIILVTTALTNECDPCEIKS